MPINWKEGFKAILVNIGVLLVTLLIFAFILEMILRLTGIQSGSELPQVHLHQPSAVPGLVYEFIPNLKDLDGFGGETINTNSLGLRGPAIDPNKPTIAMIGDSYTFGFGVSDDETNAYYLSERFPNYTVVNAGVNGYNIEQEALQYETKIAQLDPKLVILQFIFNDAAPKGWFNEEGFIMTGPRAGSGTTVETDDKTGTIEAPGLLNFPGKRFLQEHSALFKFIERKTKWLPFRKHASVFSSEWTQKDFEYYTPWFDRLTTAIGDRPKMFVIWPEIWIHLRTRTEIKRMAAERGWFVLDLYDFYGNNYEALGWDFHPTADMHKKVADVMTDAIEYYKLLP